MRGDLYRLVWNSHSYTVLRHYNHAIRGKGVSNYISDSIRSALFAHIDTVKELVEGVFSDVFKNR